MSSSSCSPWVGHKKLPRQLMPMGLVMAVAVRNRAAEIKSRSENKGRRILASDRKAKDSSEMIVGGLHSRRTRQILMCTTSCKLYISMISRLFLATIIEQKSDVVSICHVFHTKRGLNIYRLALHYNTTVPRDSMRAILNSFIDFKDSFWKGKSVTKAVS